MAITIPQAVFTKYAEFAEAMLATTGFGHLCELVYTDEIETITEAVPEIRQRKVMNLQKSSPDAGFKRGTSTFKTVEIKESITLRLYWDKKDFKKFGGVEIPSGSVMTIGAYADLPNVSRAKALLINTNRTGNVEWRFARSSEPVLHGLDDNYFMCFWERV